MVWYCIVLSLVLWRLVRQEIPPLNVFNHTMGAKHGNTHELFEGKILTPVAHSWTSYPEHFPSSLGRTSCRKSQTERWRGDRVSLTQRIFNPKFITCSRPRGLELVNTMQVIKPRLDWKICLKQKIDVTVLVKNCGQWSEQEVKNVSVHNQQRVIQIGELFFTCRTTYMF